MSFLFAYAISTGPFEGRGIGGVSLDPDVSHYGHIVKEAPLVIIRSSFNKSFEIGSTKELEQNWLSSQVLTRIKGLRQFISVCGI